MTHVDGFIAVLSADILSALSKVLLNSFIKYFALLGVKLNKQTIHHKNFKVNERKFFHRVHTGKSGDSWNKVPHCKNKNKEVCIGRKDKGRRTTKKETLEPLNSTEKEIAEKGTKTMKNIQWGFIC